MGLLGFLFGNSYSNRARRDQHSFGTSLKNLVSPVNSYGTCFSCEGSGTKTFDCKPCDGTGVFTGTCRTCNGAGTKTIPRSLACRAMAAGFSRVQSASAVAGQGSTNRQPPFLVGNAVEPAHSLTPVQDAKEAVTSRLLAENAVAPGGIASDVIMTRSSKPDFR